MGTISHMGSAIGIDGGHVFDDCSQHWCFTTYPTTGTVLAVLYETVRPSLICPSLVCSYIISVSGLEQRLHEA